MRLYEFFDSAGSASPAPTRPVTFKALGKASGENQRLQCDVDAVLVYVDEVDRAEAERKADEALAEEFKGKAVGPSPARREDEKTYHVLFAALRDAARHEAQFCRNVLELRRALVLPEAQRLWGEYQRFVADEFPEWVSAEDKAKLVDEAKK